MIWAGILGSEMVHPFRVTKGLNVQDMWSSWPIISCRSKKKKKKKVNLAGQHTQSLAAKKKHWLDSLMAMGTEGEKHHGVATVISYWKAVLRILKSMWEGELQCASHQPPWEPVLVSTHEIQAETIHAITRVANMISRKGSCIIMES